MRYQCTKVKITRASALAALTDDPEGEIVPLSGSTAGRGTGVLNMARSTCTGSQPFASGELGYHVLDALLAIDEAVSSEQVVKVASIVNPVPLVPEGLGPICGRTVAL